MADGDRSKVQLNETLSISRANHDKLVQHCYTRVQACADVRDGLVTKFMEIDKELAGHIVPTDDDKKRIKDNKLGKGPKTVDENVQFALMHLDEAATYLLGVLAPEPGIYSAVAPSSKQSIANGFTALMNKHARYFKHYRAMSKSILDIVKFNLGGNWVEWETARGPKIKRREGLLTDIESDAELIAGNRLSPLDPYNFLWDPAVSPVDVGAEGEFAGEVDLIRGFKLEKERQSGFYFGPKKMDFAYGKLSAYKMRPSISTYYTATSGSHAPNWDQVLNSKYGAEGLTFDWERFQSEAIERARLYIWLPSSEFGLGGSKGGMELWRVHMVNSSYIVRADKLANVHNKIPVAVSMPMEDGLQLQSRSSAEILLPLQRFASSQLNVKQRADRKRLFGLTIYNRRVIPLLENEDLGGGKVPANSVGEDSDLRKHILQISDAPDTTQVMQDVEATLQLMQKLLPTAQAQQVASLERATRYQAASYVQASNRRNQKLAKLVVDQCFDPLRVMQALNVMQYQGDIEFVDPTTGENIRVNPKEFVDLDIEFTISDGLRGLDKLLITESLHEVINMLLQSQVARDYDIGAIINYYLTLQGDMLDFKQFKYKHPIDALPQPMKDLAFQLLQQAAGASAADKGEATQAAVPGAPQNVGT